MVRITLASLTAGAYSLGSVNIGNASLEWSTRADNGSRQQQLYFTDSLLPSTINFSRADDSVYAGTFELTLRNSYYSSQTIRLTDGRFDIRRW